MYHFRRNRKLYMTYGKTAIIAVLFLLIAIPFVRKVVRGGTTYSPEERYMVVLNGEELGYVSEESVATDALLSVRSRLNSENNGLALVEADMDVYTERAGGAVLTEQQLSATMYSMLSEDVI